MCLKKIQHVMNLYGGREGNHKIGTEFASTLNLLAYDSWKQMMAALGRQHIKRHELQMFLFQL